MRDPWQALADPVRRTILELLSRRPRPAGEIAAEFEITRPAISRHLRVLREAGLVEAEREGRERVYSLAAAPLEELVRELRGLVAGAERREPGRSAPPETSAPPEPTWKVW